MVKSIVISCSRYCEVFHLESKHYHTQPEKDIIHTSNQNIETEDHVYI